MIKNQNLIILNSDEVTAGTISTVSGSLFTSIQSTSGALQLELNEASGYLQGQITALIEPSSCLLVSGSQYNGVYAATPVTTSVLTQPTLNVNGLVYLEDDNSADGFNLTYSGGVQYMIWNYTTNEGFSLVDSDKVILTYNVV